MARIKAHMRANAVGYVALFFALSTGAYAAGLAPNSVKSKHIQDGQVTGADVADQSVTGTEIAENTLGEVPRATISGHGGYGRQSGGPERGASCNPEPVAWMTCASVVLTPSAPGRVLLTGRLEMTAENDDSESGTGECRLGSSASDGIPGTTVTHFLNSKTGRSEWITITAVTGVFQPGTYGFGIDCRAGGNLMIDQARITAVVISPF